MRIKRLFILIAVLFIITGCTAEYELTYENGVFSEHIVVKDEVLKNNNSGIMHITELKTNPKLAKIDEKNSYKYKFSTDGTNDILNLDFTYDNISIEKSPVFNQCFRYQNFIDGDNYYYIDLETDMFCEYLSTSDIVFKTDKLVLTENADEKDVDKGIYKWNDFDGGHIYIQVSKTETISDKEQATHGEFIPWYIKLIISLIAVVVVIVILRKIKRDHE